MGIRSTLYMIARRVAYPQWLPIARVCWENYYKEPSCLQTSHTFKLKWHHTLYSLRLLSVVFLPLWSMWKRRKHILLDVLLIRASKFPSKSASYQSFVVCGKKGSLSKEAYKELFSFLKWIDSYIFHILSFLISLLYFYYVSESLVTKSVRRQTSMTSYRRHY